MRTTTRARLLAASALSVVLLTRFCAAASGPCSLIIASRPRGATIMLDGKEVGKTTLSLSGLSKGQHEIVIIQDGYFQWQKRITLKPGFNSVDAELEKRPVDQVKATPDAPQPDAEGGNDDAPEDEKKVLPKYIEIECLGCKGNGLMNETGCSACSITGIDQETGAGGQPKACVVCKGKARVQNKCRACKGEGKLPTTTGRTVECPKCAGKGSPPCTFCRGSGKMKRPNPELAKFETAACTRCEGTGSVLRVKCRGCSGKGEITRGRRTGDRSWIVTLPCTTCGGKGERPVSCGTCSSRGYLGGRIDWRVCLDCSGTGNVYPACPACRGRGWIKARKTRSR